MMKTWLMMLLLFFSIEGFSADIENLTLPKEYSFIRPQIKFGMWPGIFADLLYILNNAQPEKNSLSEQEAKNIALANVNKFYPFLKSSSFVDAEQKYLRIENLPNSISYYEVMFDANSEEPFSLEGEKIIDPYYMIVLMDKSVWVMESMDKDKHWSRKLSGCEYSKIGTTWSRKNCT